MSFENNKIIIFNAIKVIKHLTREDFKNKNLIKKYYLFLIANHK